MLCTSQVGLEKTSLQHHLERHQVEMMKMPNVNNQMKPVAQVPPIDVAAALRNETIVTF